MKVELPVDHFFDGFVPTLPDKIFPEGECDPTSRIRLEQQYLTFLVFEHYCDMIIFRGCYGALELRSSMSRLEEKDVTRIASSAELVFSNRCGLPIVLKAGQIGQWILLSVTAFDRFGQITIPCLPIFLVWGFEVELFYVVGV